MFQLPELSDVLNDLFDLSAAGHSEDVAFVLSALIDDMRARSALDELEWVLTSLRDTNPESTSCMILATLVLTKDFPSLKRKCLCDWYLRWCEENRTPLCVTVLRDTLEQQETSDEYRPASTSSESVPSIEDT